MFGRFGLSAAAIVIVAASVEVHGSPDSEHPATPHGPLAFTDTYYSHETVQIQMRDGVMLRTQIFRPRAIDTELPILLLRSPYGIGSEGADEPARWRVLAEDGYIIAVQEVRGTGESGGKFRMNPPRAKPGEGASVDESTDAYDTVDWLVLNVAGNNGLVGAVGCSYSGYAAVMAALSGHPSVAAVSPQAAMADLFRGDDFYWNGIPILGQAPFYATRMDHRRTLDARPDMSDAYEWYLQAGALKDVQQRAFVVPSPTWQQILSNYELNEFWAPRVLAREAVNLRIPALHVMGWYDGEDFPGPIRLFEAMDNLDQSPSNRAIIGPWNHCMWNEAPPGNSLGPLQFGTDTADKFKELEARFFAHHLKGEGDLTDVPDVLMFETGEFAWRSFQRLPHADNKTEDQTLFLMRSGQLSRRPDATGSSDVYRSDPMKPVPYARRPIGFFAGRDLVPEDGKSRSLFLLEDQRFVHGRPDVLTWVSEPLEADTVLAGQAVLSLFAETSATDMDWIVQLIDVYPDNFDPVFSGYRLPVSRGAIRGSLHDDLSKAKAIEPGKIIEYTIPLELRLHRFKEGHRILVQLQNTYFPYLARNPQKFVSPTEATVADFEIATNEIHYGETMPSRITLPVLEF